MNTVWVAFCLVLASLTAAVAQTCSWTELGPRFVPNGEGYDGTRIPVSGRVTGIAISAAQPQTVYLGSALGGVWRSRDLGHSWEPLSDSSQSLSVGALAVDQRDANRIFVGTGEGNVALRPTIVKQDRPLVGHVGVGVLHSADGGANWRVSGAAEFSGHAFFQLEIRPSNKDEIVAATTAGIFRSRDSASSWQRLAEGLPHGAVTSIAFSPSDTNTVYAGVYGSGVYRTGSFGSEKPKWERLFGGLPLSNISRISISTTPAAPNRVIALISDLSSRLRGVYLSEDKGQIWTKLAGAPDLLQGQGFFNMLLASSPSQPTVFYLGGVGDRASHESSLFKANWQGNRWVFLPIGKEMHVDFHSLAFDPHDPARLFVGNDGGIWRSDDNGSTWLPLNRGLGTLQFLRIDQHPLSSAIIVGGTQDNGTLLYQGDPIWTHADDGDGGYVAIDPDDPKTVYNAYYLFRIARSDKYGLPGTFVPKYPSLQSFRSAFVAPYALDPTNTHRIMLGLERIYVSDDRGESWRSVTTDLTRGPSSENRAVISVVTFSDSGAAFVGTSDGRVWRLTQENSTWRAVELLHADEPTLGADYVTAIQPVSADGSELLIAFDRRETPRLWHLAVPETRGEPKWTRVDTAGSGLPPGTIYSIEWSRSKHVYIGGEAAVYSATIGDWAWQSVSKGLPGAAVVHLQRHRALSLLRAATHGRGVWELSLEGACPPVEVYVRDHAFDQGRRIPGSDQFSSVPLDSPSIFLTQKQIPDDTYPLPTDKQRLAPSEDILVHGIVSNRGSDPSDVQAELYVSFADDAPPWDGGNGSSWMKLGSVNLDGVSMGSPKLASWRIQSRTFNNASKLHLLLAVHAPSDNEGAWQTGAPIDGIVRREPQLALKSVEFSR